MKNIYFIVLLFSVSASKLAFPSFIPSFFLFFYSFYQKRDLYLDIPKEITSHNRIVPWENCPVVRT